MHKKLIFCVFVFMFNIKTNAQNLVPNPSFEIYSSCPTTYSQINYALPWIGTSASTDYFNSCSSTSSYSNVPNGAGGFQLARTGNAYAGIFCFTQGTDSMNREYLQTKLIDTLTVNKCYIVTFYVNLSNKSIYGVKNIAASFTANGFTTSSSTIAYLPSHIYKLNNPIISDTLNWVKTQGIYFAQGNELYITIGNFKNISNSEDTLNVNPFPAGTLNAAYYYIDDISVIPLDSMSGGMPAFAGNDTSVILGDSVFIGQQITNLNCNWYIGSTLIADSVSGLYVKPVVNTTYIVKQNLCGKITYDTVNVTVLPVGIEENSWSKKINIYPNPNTGNFSINFSQTGNYLIEITNSIGVCVFKDKANTNNYTVDATFSSGIYILKIYDSENNKTAFKKLVIQSN